MNKKKNADKKKKAKLVVVKNAKGYSDREMGDCSLVALVIKIPVAACK